MIRWSRVTALATLVAAVSAALAAVAASIQVYIAANAFNDYAMTLKFQRRLDACVEFSQAYQSFRHKISIMNEAKKSKQDIQQIYEAENSSLEAWAEVEGKREKLVMLSSALGERSSSKFWSFMGSVDKNGNPGEEVKGSLEFSPEYLQDLRRVRDGCKKEIEY